jgi:hypothetical protein
MQAIFRRFVSGGAVVVVVVVAVERAGRASGCEERRRRGVVGIRGQRMWDGGAQMHGGEAGHARAWVRQPGVLLTLFAA